MEESTAQFDFSLEGDYVRVTCTGVMDKNAYLKLIPLLVSEKSKYNDQCRYIIDIRKAMHRVTVLDQFELALLAAQMCPSYKIVTLVDKNMDLTGLYENATNNRGLQTLVTSQESVALEWLLKL